MSTLETNIGYHFRDKTLLTLALAHPSLNTPHNNNQRLEFLGDAVLGMVIAKLLYEIYPDEPEGKLARRHAALICGTTLTKVGRTLAIGDALQFGQSEINADGKNTDSNLEDAVEALIGAIYLDGGLQAVETCILPLWTPLAKNITSPPKDAKSMLQEWAQGNGLPLPEYTLIDTTGAAHTPIFTIEVSVVGYPSLQTKGTSKRATEQDAAKQMLEAVTS